jgi:hypothetical protein
VKQVFSKELLHMLEKRFAERPVEPGEEKTHVAPELVKVALAGAFECGRWAGAEEERKLPIPMILACPRCHAPHIDKMNTGHKTHDCEECGKSWQPCERFTIGVRDL